MLEKLKLNLKMRSILLQSFAFICILFRKKISEVASKEQLTEHKILILSYAHFISEHADVS